MAFTTINQVIKANQPNKFVDHFLMEKKTPIDNKLGQKWTDQIRDDNQNWKNIYTNRLSATKEIKTSEFSVQIFDENYSYKQNPDADYSYKQILTEM